MRNTYTVTIQSNQGREPKASFAISGQKARAILEILEPNIIKKRKMEEKHPVKLDTFFA